MLKLQITTQDDLNESNKLQRRQIFEEERKKRILNSKQRLLGLDMEALQRQISEKNQQRQVEAEWERRYEEQNKCLQNAVHAKTLEMEKRKRIVESDLNYYRCRFQRYDQRREYDLNDPQWMKKSQPARIADHDPSLGVSSAQVFSGEDLGNRERKRRQREQQRAWLDQQVLERKQADACRLEADRIIQQSLFSRDKVLEDMAKSERRVKDQMVDSIRQFNTVMAKNKHAKRLTEKQNTAEDDMAEIYNMLSSDMLTQNPDVAQSRLDPNKKIAFMYRGMTPEELKTFREAQNRQRIEKEKINTENQLIEKQWEQYALNMDKELMLKQLELDRKQKLAIQDEVRFNEKLAVQQKARRDYINKELYVNRMSQEFYDQFNKTSR